jgi:hypothetical protein
VFVNRAPERQELLSRVALGAERASDLILVRGTERIGKTQLLRWCLAACLVRGYNLKYIDLGGEETLAFRDVLRLIRGGDAGRLLCRPLAETAFAGFDQQWGRFWDGQPQGSEDWIPQMFASFGDALVAAAREPLSGGPRLARGGRCVRSRLAEVRFLCRWGGPEQFRSLVCTLRFVSLRPTSRLSPPSATRSTFSRMFL